MAALELPLSPLILAGVPLQAVSPGAVVPPLSPEMSRDVEREADQLFHTHSVEQIKKIAKDKRLEIDRRREDLRQMVGERYRDLIDAADSIMHMKKCSEQAKQSVATMESLCQRLQQVHFLRGSGGWRGPAPKTESHSVAAQVKLLADAPENIWLYLESHSYLSASLTYLLARHVFSQLTVKLGSERSFAVVQRLWHSVATFKDTIVKSASNHLCSAELEQEAMVQSLCAVALLEGGSPRQLLAQTLLARKTSIQSVFSPRAHHVSVKAQVCQLVRTVVESLTQISAIFCAQQNKNGSSLLVERLVQLSKKEWIKDVIPPVLASRLPENITGFTPKIPSTSLTQIPVNDIHSSTSDWVAMCVSDVTHGMEGILQHVTTFKALASIREAVHSLLSKKPNSSQDCSTDELSLAEAREEWTRICQNVLGSKLCVWDTFLRSLLLQRAKALVDKHLAKGGANANTLLGDLLRSHISADADLWSEEPASLNSNPLSLKAKACSPHVFRSCSFCQGFDEGFKNLISDITHFFGDNGPADWRDQPINKVANYPFSLWEDADSLQTHLQEAVGESIGRFLKNIGCRVSEIQDQLKNQHQDCSLVDRLVVLGNLCQCLMDCCPNFSFLASGCSRRTKFSTKSHKRAIKEGASGLAAADLLQEKAILIFKVWSKWCSEEIVALFQEQLSAEMELNSLASSLVWDEVQISEESESGEKVTSVIRVPSQTSVYVTSLLFALSQEISRIGGHALDRFLLQDLSSSVFIGVLESFESLLSSLGQKIPQPCALQLLFNLKFFSSILVHNASAQGAEKTDSRFKAVVESLQSFVDPFDLDVFMPHILTNLERQLARSSVLFGLLLALKDSPISTSFSRKSTTGGGQEQHIVLPVAAPISRLPSLPTTTVPTLTKNHPIQESIDTNYAPFKTVTFFHHF